MKIVSHTLEQIAGIEIYPLISSLIFVTLFVGVIIYAVKADKSRMDEMASSPLDD